MHREGACGQSRQVAACLGGVQVERRIMWVGSMGRCFTPCTTAVLHTICYSYECGVLVPYQLALQGSSFCKESCTHPAIVAIQVTGLPV
jgi:hypothetical protein